MLPLLLNIALVGLLVYVAVLFSVRFQQFVLIDGAAMDLVGDTWLLAFLTWALSYGLKLVMFYLVWQFYQLLSLIFLAPLFSYLSEKVQEVLSGIKTPFSILKFAKDSLRGVQLAIVNVFYQCVWVGGLYAAALVVPILIPFLPLALFLVGAYFYGFAMIDYRNEFFGLSPKESRTTVKQLKWFALGNGVAFQVVLMVPLVGTLFAPSVALVAAALGVRKLQLVVGISDVNKTNR